MKNAENKLRKDLENKKKEEKLMDNGRISIPMGDGVELVFAIQEPYGKEVAVFLEDTATGDIFQNIAVISPDYKEEDGVKNFINDAVKVEIDYVPVLGGSITMHTPVFPE